MITILGGDRRDALMCGARELLDELQVSGQFCFPYIYIYLTFSQKLKMHEIMFKMKCI